MKKIISVIMLLVLSVICCFSMTACGEDLVSVKIKVQIYNPDKAVETVTLDYTFYRHLAPESTEQFINLAKKGYYTNAPYYHFTVGGQSTALVGEYKYDANGNFIENPIAIDYIKVEYPLGGVSGSDLRDTVGNICAFRWWDANEDFKNGGHETSSMSNLMSTLNGTAFIDNINGGTTVAVVGVLSSDSLASFKRVANSSSAENKLVNWTDLDNTESYHIFYYIDGDGEFVKVILNSDDYADKVEVRDGATYYNYDTLEDDNNSETDEKLWTKVYSPTSDDKVEGKTLAKYSENTITLPKYEYRVVISSIVIDD
ncbi:MAG: hypothetical protein J6V68_04890 [Clostridia bacterium]|nr:hypothetical protein [Clostridia bacterium]